MNTTLSPYDLSNAVAVGPRVFRKQVLPIGSIDYKGRKIEFSREYLADLASSFTQGAYDQVPFILADVDNRHTMDPERFRGEVKGFELTEDGLDAVIEFSTEEAAAAVRSNPRLGVSARIVEGLQRADGKTWTRAVQHVLGTMDPRVTGLRPWQAINLSGYDGSEDDLDLTNESYEGAKMVPGTDTDAVVTEKEAVDLSTVAPEDLTDEEIASILDLASDEDDEDEDEDEDSEDEDEDSDEEDSDDDDEEDEDEEEGASTTLSNPADDDSVIDLAQQRAELQRDRADLEIQRFLHQGVPPAVLDLARPFLEQVNPTIDLSNGESLNSADAIRSLLTEFAGVVDLKPEIGHADLSNSQDQDPLNAALDQWAAEFGS